MTTTDSVSVFAEGTFEDQVRIFFSCASLCLSGAALRAIVTHDFQIKELVDYLARGLSDDDRQKSFGRILELIKTEPPGGQTPQEPPAISQENQVKVLSLLVPEVKGLGEGSEKGTRYLANPWNVQPGQLKSLLPEVEGFFNLLFARLFNLFPTDSDEIKVHVGILLKAITSSKGHFSSQYRL